MGTAASSYTLSNKDWIVSASDYYSTASTPNYSLGWHENLSGVRKNGEKISDGYGIAYFGYLKTAGTLVCPGEKVGFSNDEKKGYSGTAVFSRRLPLNVEYELPDPDYHGEGRVVHLEFPELHFFNIYFPNGGEELSKGVFKRVPYKMGFFDAFFDYA